VRIGSVVPKDDRKATGDRTVQIAPSLVAVVVIDVQRRIIADRFKAREQKFPVAPLSPAEEFENLRIDRQPRLHSPGGSGIFSTRSLTSSSVS